MKNRNILITNDDGIDADGIIRLASAAREFGNVWVVAPEGQRSAMSHAITLRTYMDVYETDFPVDGVRAFKTTGTPADCVRFGRLNIVEGNTDIVLTGINFGYNSGSDIQYSATAGSAFEAACEGVHAIALSEGATGVHEITDKYLSQIIGELIDSPLGFNEIWNVNFPGIELSRFKGIKRDCKVSPRAFYKDRYAEELLPDGGRRLTVDGIYGEDAPENTDFRAIVDGYISISRLKNICEV